MKKVNLGFYVAAAFSGLFGVVACSSSTPTENNPGETRQCTTNQDCENLGGEFRGRVCSAEGVCVIKDQTPIGADASDTGCVSHDQCTTSLGYPSLCPTPGGKCVQLGNERCEVIGNYKAENRLVFGFQVNTRSADRNFVLYGESHTKEVKMAFDEIVNAFPGGVAGGKTPVAVLCNGASSMGNSDQAPISHLLDTVDADVYFSPAYEDVVAAAKKIKEGSRRRPLYCIDCTMPVREMANSAGGDGDAIFARFQPSVEGVGLYQHFLSEFEGRKRTGGFTGNLKVALVVWEGNYYSADAEALRSTLRFNEKSVLENGTDFKYVVSSGLANASWFQRLDEIIQMHPDVLMFVGLDELTRGSIPYLEANWVGTKPRYIVANTVAQQQFPSVAGNNAELVSRMIGVGAPFAGADEPIDITPLVGFLGRFYSRYPETMGLNTPPFWAYEGIYQTLWAMAYAPETGKVTVPKFVEGLQKIGVAEGTKVSVGPASLGVLGTAPSIKLLGLFGSFAMDPLKGRPAGAVSDSSCLKLADGTVQLIPNGVVHLTGPKLTVGTDNCPLMP
ncbi:MAG: hypothetical protein KBF88_04435 [Polyangiaceae bacterium]|nr:hypothetical protein [Polyangiaceae bacterium]